jgi:PAS domain S-box-containing protein
MDDLNLSPSVLTGKTKDELIDLVLALTAARDAREHSPRELSLFEAMFRDLPDALLLVNPDRKVRMVNHAFSRLFGYADGELEGVSTIVLYSDREEYERQGRLRYHLNAGATLDAYTHRFRRKDGTVFVGESLGSVLRTPAGKVLGFVAAAISPRPAPTASGKPMRKAAIPSDRRPMPRSRGLRT